MRPLSARVLAAFLAASALLGCAPQRPPGPLPQPSPSPSPSACRSSQPLFDEMNALSDRAEKADLADAEAASLLIEMDAALDRYLAAPPEVQSAPQVQGALERMSDLALQISLDDNASPEDAAQAEPAPLESILKETTFLAPDELSRVYGEVQAALKTKPMDFPVTVNDAVLGYVNLYQTKLRDWFSRALTRGAPHMPAMRRVFQAEGVPTSLVHLSIVESACNPRAYSRAHAAGMWQFIPGTAKRYGLTVDFWQDERFDPEISARASARYLKDLNAMFGDWHLALAAYNCGEGRIQRRLAKNSGQDFWNMREKGTLVRETREYVPAILAAILLASDPAAYGFDVPEEAEREPTEEVVIDSSTDLRVLARCAGISLEALQAINPSLKRLMTPPRAYSLRIPAGKREGFQAALSAVPPDERAALRMHTVRRGESLKRIAQKYGVSAEAIRLANLLPSRKVTAGQTLVVPLGMAASDPILFVEAPSRRKGSSGATRVYKVKRGDTLSSIARKTGVPIASIRSLNGLEKGEPLRPGQRLVLASGNVAKPHSGKSAKKGRGDAPSQAKRVHHVLKGETLFVIAKRYGVSVDQLCRANRISKGKTLHPGDTLVIP